MKHNTININALRHLAAVESKKVVGLVKACGRLYGKLALREQFTFESMTKDWSSYEMIELDHQELCKEILSSAFQARELLLRCNKAAINRGYGAVCIGLETATVSEVVKMIQTYMEDLNAQADYEAWIDESARILREKATA